MEEKKMGEEPKDREPEKGEPKSGEHRSGGDGSREPRGREPRGREPRNRESKGREPKGPFEEKVLFINRCTRVMKGGKRFSFSALVAIGDRAGKIGLGFGKANEVSGAIRKAGEEAKRKMFAFEMEEGTIPHPVETRHDGAMVRLLPAKKGHGVVAGSVIRSLLELGGVKDVVAKSLGSNNQANQAHAAIAALKSLWSRSRSEKLRKA